ncbi:MAG: hypothetical protein V4561_09440 [Bacteroidota bacterium]
MTKYTTLFILLFIKLPVAAMDYADYHRGINKAEEFIFVKNKFDSGINLYTKIFKEFDFVYAGDCLIAMQIALYVNNEKAFINFTEKAFQNGLMLRNFKKVYSIKHHSLYLKDTAKFILLYKSNRPHYLARIDTAALKTMHALKAEDQLVKNSIKWPNGQFEFHKERQKRYLPLIEKTIAELKKIAFEKGFPSDKIVGIDQSDIMRELKLNSPDMMEYWWRNKNRNECVIEKGQFQSDEDYLYSYYNIPPIIHHPKVYDIFDESYYIQQIKLGNIHPKDVAVFHDNTYTNGINTPDVPVGRCFFGCGVMAENKANDRKVKDIIINECRAKWFIAPIENDRAKWKFMQEHKMNYGWGWMGKRS